MLYTERGVYRPGETVYLTSWIRKPDLSVYAGAPCSILLQDPNGNTIFSRTLKTDKNGLIQLTFQLPDDVPGGLYRFLCKPEDGTDAPVWGNASFLAADFVPDRIKATLKQTSVFSSLLSFELDAEYYFGGMVENAPFQFNVTAAPADKDVHMSMFVNDECYLCISNLGKKSSRIIFRERWLNRVTGENVAETEIPAGFGNRRKNRSLCSDRAKLRFGCPWSENDSEIE